MGQREGENGRCSYFLGSNPEGKMSKDTGVILVHLAVHQSIRPPFPAIGLRALDNLNWASEGLKEDMQGFQGFLRSFSKIHELRCPWFWLDG